MRREGGMHCGGGVRRGCGARGAFGLWRGRAWREWLRRDSSSGCCGCCGSRGRAGRGRRAGMCGAGLGPGVVCFMLRLGPWRRVPGRVGLGGLVRDGGGADACRESSGPRDLGAIGDGAGARLPPVVVLSAPHLRRLLRPCAQRGGRAPRGIVTHVLPLTVRAAIVRVVVDDATVDVLVTRLDEDVANAWLHPKAVDPDPVSAVPSPVPARPVVRRRRSNRLRLWDRIRGRRLGVDAPVIGLAERVARGRGGLLCGRGFVSWRGLHGHGGGRYGRWRRWRAGVPGGVHDARGEERGASEPHPQVKQRFSHHAALLPASLNVDQRRGNKGRQHSFGSVFATT